MNANVLVVDDEADIAREFGFSLESEGYRVDIAHSGEEAWEKYQQQYFDVVLVDWKMGRMSGMELMEKIDNHIPRSRVIMITAFGDEASAIEAHHYHAFDFLKKPVDIDVLLDAVAKAAALRDPVIAVLEQWVERHPEQAERPRKAVLTPGGGQTVWSAQAVLEQIQRNTEQGRKEYQKILQLTVDLLSRGKLEP